jgi:hypothetical protein
MKFTAILPPQITSPDRRVSPMRGPTFMRFESRSGEALSAILVRTSALMSAAS